jgi:hypothetical protein
VSTWPLELRRTAAFPRRRVLTFGPTLAQLRTMLAAVETTLAFLLIAACLLRVLVVSEKA